MTERVRTTSRRRSSVSTVERLRFLYRLLRTASFIACLAVAAGLSACAWQPASDLPDPATFHSLIEKLGDASYREREKASSELLKLGKAALEPLRSERARAGPEVRARIEKLIAALENRLDGLLSLYRAYGLPMPPPSAPLVKYSTTDVTYPRYEDGPAPPSLGLRTHGTDEEGSVHLLLGPWERKISNVETTIIEANDLTGRAAQDVIKASPPADGLALAMQCADRGWIAFSQELLDARARTGSDVSPNRAIHLMAWQYWMWKMVKPGTDRAAILRRLKEIVRDEASLQDESHQALLDHLEVSLQPRAAATPPEQAVERLLNTASGGFREPPDRMGPIHQYILDHFEVSSQPLAGSPYFDVAQLGPQAVPALISRLDDPRLSRASRYTLDELKSKPDRRLAIHVTVGELASHLLYDLAGDDLADARLPAEDRFVLNKAAVLTWWTRVRDENEERYLASHALTPFRGGDEGTPLDEPAPKPGTSGPPERVSKEANAIVIWVLGKKFPNRLPELYRDALSPTTRAGSWEIAETIRASALPQATKAHLFAKAATHPDPIHWLPALQQLAAVDSVQFAKSLKARLNRLSEHVVSLRPGGTTDLDVVRLVPLTRYSEVWAALRRKTMKFGVAARLQIWT